MAKKTQNWLLRAALIYLIATAMEPAHANQIASKMDTKPIDVGNQLQLFVDDALIESMSGTSLVLQEPIPREVALRFNEPWETQSETYSTVFKDGSLYRMYYTCQNEQKVDITCYAESKDGVKWVKPTLGLFKFRGSYKNNIVWTVDDKVSVANVPLKRKYLFNRLQASQKSIIFAGCNFAPFKDTNPNTRKDELYKAIDGAPPIGLGSPDGIHWHILQEKALMTGDAYDSLNTVLWNPEIKKYVAYVRSFTVPGDFRAIARRISSNFHIWEKGKLIDTGEAPIEHLYTNGITPYFRSPSLLIGLAMRFVGDRKLIEDFPYLGISEAVFMSSRDGIHFDRRFMEAFIRPGIDRENWTWGSIMPTWGIVPTSDEEMSIYYAEHAGRETDQLRRASLRTDGFVSVHADYWGGEMTTKPLVFSGSQLIINAATSVVGNIRVEVLDVSGKPIREFPILKSSPFYGDSINHAVSWKGSNANLKALEGQPVRLRFVMRDADLYSFRFGS